MPKLRTKFSVKVFNELPSSLLVFGCQMVCQSGLKKNREREKREKREREERREKREERERERTERTEREQKEKREEKEREREHATTGIEKETQWVN